MQSKDYSDVSRPAFFNNNQVHATCHFHCRHRGAGTPDVRLAANIKVEKDDKLNTVVRISVDSRDPARTKELTEAPSLLPQTYRIENPS
jgi:hypothetical protein